MKATGWAEEVVWHLPFRRALQYAHANMLMEGRATSWHQALPGEREEQTDAILAMTRKTSYTREDD